MLAWLVLSSMPTAGCGGAQGDGSTARDAGGADDSAILAGDAPSGTVEDSGTSATDARTADATMPESLATEGIADFTLRDRAREREILVRVHYPVALSTAAPLVLVSHGGDGSVRGHLSMPSLATELSTHGYVTVHLNHLESADEITHRRDRPTDVSFVLDWILDPETELPPDAPPLDAARIAHVGHSWGAYTAHAVAGGTFDHGHFRDARIRAIVPLSPQGWDQFGAYDRGPDDNTWRTVEVPSLCIIGELEMVGPVRLGRPANWRLRPFERYPDGPPYFAMILPGQEHEDLGGAGPPEVQRTIARNARAFLDLTLRGDDTGTCTVGELEPLPGVVVMRRGVSCGS